MKKPEVTVLMPVYNAEKYLRFSVESILTQTFGDFEFSIIDDGSTDASWPILEALANTDARIRLARNEGNRGLVHSLNQGLRSASGRYIARMDADDISMPERLKTQVDFLEKNREIFLVGSMGIIMDSGNRDWYGLNNLPTRPEDVERTLAKGSCFIHPSIMFRSDPSLFYREKMHFVEDYDLYLRLLLAGKRLANIPEPLIRYRFHPHSVSSLQSVRQIAFARKAREFYIQARVEGKDEYESFTSDSILRCDEDELTSEAVLEDLIRRSFLMVAPEQARHWLGVYRRKYGSRRKYTLLWPLSYLPKPALVLFLRLAVNLLRESGRLGMRPSR